MLFLYSGYALKTHSTAIKWELLTRANYVPFIFMIFSHKSNNMSIFITLIELEKLRPGEVI